MTPHRIALAALGLTLCTSVPVAGQSQTVLTGKTPTADSTAARPQESISLNFERGDFSAPDAKPSPPPPGKDYFPDCFICD